MENNHNDNSFMTRQQYRQMRKRQRHVKDHVGKFGGIKSHRTQVSRFRPHQSANEYKIKRLSKRLNKIIAVVILLIIIVYLILIFINF